MNLVHAGALDDTTVVELKPSAELFSLIHRLRVARPNERDKSGDGPARQQKEKDAFGSGHGERIRDKG
jgi:hypothetical protein